MDINFFAHTHQQRMHAEAPNAPLPVLPWHLTLDEAAKEQQSPTRRISSVWETAAAGDRGGAGAVQTARDQVNTFYEGCSRSTELSRISLI